MLKLFVAPLHVPYTGVTTMFATWGVLPALLTVNTPMFPLPLPARPMLVLSFIHVYPVAVPVNVTAVVLAPLHTVWFPAAPTDGVGFTVMLNTWLLPVQLTPPTYTPGSP